MLYFHSGDAPYPGNVAVPAAKIYQCFYLALTAKGKLYSI